MTYQPAYNYTYQTSLLNSPLHHTSTIHVMAEVASQQSVDALTTEAKQVPAVMPLEVLDRSIGTQVRILLTNNKEFVGKLAGFDDFVNMVLESVVEINNDGSESKPIKKMLLNGTLIAMISPLI